MRTSYLAGERIRPRGKLGKGGNERRDPRGNNGVRGDGTRRRGLPALLVSP